ncbi:MAG TPA: hypothetical protein PK079_14540 [Leptospiraceae bacterium]|nr:hypothetical protein [Leptospiraceae bacterium]HMW07717.1 hypothetical protein [Leptospiraceae bacterium]HMX32013.1 hypothetical protein [Leptospiraceae bacterium]HMY33383.1 hypothetical protein [Leptospiraceae bacterium]HNA08668.1 hypothetical protein [Leptospiraceae bacterium]
MIHNRVANFFLLFFIIFQSACSSIGNNLLENRKFLEGFIGDYYQNAKVLNTNSFFEKQSSHYKYLVIRQNENGKLSVREIDISFYAYTNKFKEDVTRLFFDKAPPKYNIYEKVKYGEGQRKIDSNDLEVEYTNFSIRDAQSTDLLSAIDKFISSKTDAQQLFHEKVTYSQTPDEGLWKLEEVHLKDGQEAIRWKHYPSGTVARNYPHTEFSPNKNTLEYSRIYAFEDYSYKKIFKDIPSAIKLYNSKDYTLYYYPMEILDAQNESLISSGKNQQLSLYKIKLPIIIYKKKESMTDESKR